VFAITGQAGAPPAVINIGALAGVAGHWRCRILWHGIGTRYRFRLPSNQRAAAMKPCLFLLVSLVAGLPLHAQARPAAPAANPAVGTSRTLWTQITGYITTAAEELPESTYAYRPTPEVRTFGQLIGHVAGAQYLICGAAVGDPERTEDEIEKTRTTKAALVAALKESTAYCAKAYAQTDAAAQQPTKLFGQPQTRLFALALNATHNAEHYGNIVTYLRMNGVVPPSSRPRT
jgi:uncharacterized damage-inducible protein DinB